MRLQRFRVTNFRSVEDSGWLDVSDVTALIGVNESGKTNLLLPLWKLNPARGGELVPTADYPKKMFGQIRLNPSDYKFIEAEFDCQELSEKFSRITGYPASELQRISVSKYYDGKSDWSFLDINRPSELSKGLLVEILSATRSAINNATPLKGEIDVHQNLLAALDKRIDEMKWMDMVGTTTLSVSKSEINNCLSPEPLKTSVITPLAEQAVIKIQELIDTINRPLPQAMDGLQQLVLAEIPSFVYYSNYGNLDSEIYLPHVVDNLNRDDLGNKEADKARTLRVLFSFVQLEPAEILELGQEFIDQSNPNRSPTQDEVDEIATRKKERSILLQSAGTRLTEKFREWWKQGDYRFRFEADGNHFRIWVADDLRPQEIELENRSTGLQWFLSFYLVFLVESIEAHRNSMLLLDEPGLSLHPLAQRDLSKFFDNLSKSNQLIYTTHSPFLIDADRLDRAVKVFVNTNGGTEASSDLRANVGRRQEGAAYAVYSALNLSIAESLLVGCTPVIVEGASDQHYLTLIKILLIGAAKISPNRELVFPPSGGVKTAKSIAGMLGAKDTDLPKMFLDGDHAGATFAESARKGLYAGDLEKIKLVTDFSNIAGGEIEDLVPPKFLAPLVDRLWRESETPFQDEIKDGSAVVPQIEAWAAKQGIRLTLGWKVDLAREVKRVGLVRGIQEFDELTISTWKAIFDWFDT